MRRLLWLGMALVLVGCGGSGFDTPTPTAPSVPQVIPHTPTPTSFIPFPPTQSALTPTAAPLPPLRSPTPLTGQGAVTGSAAGATVVPIAASPLPTAVMSSSDGAAATVAKLKSAGLPIGDSVTYTVATDPNNLLGRPGQYMSKVNFTDTRLQAQSQNMDISDGGSVEAFATKADATTRFAYLEVMAKNPPFGEYHYQRDTIILRLSFRLTPDQAAQYESAFNK